MPNTLSQDKADAIAVEYCNNGFKKVMALLAVGYKQSYANCRGLKLYDNGKVKTAIARIKTAGITKTGFTIAQAQAEYEEARLLAMRVNQPAAAASATTGKARLYGMDKDANIGEKTIIIISPKQRKPIASKQLSDQPAGKVEPLTQVIGDGQGVPGNGGQ